MPPAGLARLPWNASPGRRVGGTFAGPARPAGVVAPDDLPMTPTYPSTVPDFASAVASAGFWRTPRSRCFASGARVLADVLSELGVSAPLAWTREVLDQLHDHATARGIGQAALPLAVGAGAVTVPRDWIRVALWVAYHEVEYPAHWEVVTLPETIVAPRFGAALGTPADHVACTRGGADTAVPGDPFPRVYEEAGFDLSGDVIQVELPPPSDGLSFGKFVVGAIAAYLGYEVFL